MSKKASLGKPLKTFAVRYQDFQGAGVEKFYFFLAEFLEQNLGFEVEKLEDAFTSAQGSAYWGNMSQKLTIQQEKAAQYLGTIGGMIKSIHQMIHELRIMDERKQFYEDSKKGDKAAELALKSIWVDMVDGGGKSPYSVTGLAQQVGFVLLPDLFFNTHIKSSKDIDKKVDSMKAEGINKTVRNVLKRKFKQYLLWKEKTDVELKARRNFTLKYLRQHFNVTKLYISWVKPYLRNIQSLKQGDTLNNKDIISAAETAVIDLELFGMKKMKATDAEFKKFFPVIKIDFHFKVKPDMMFTQEYQRAPLHMGTSEITFQAYTLTVEEMAEYKKKKDEEDLELMYSVNAALDALKDDLEKYLTEAGELTGDIPKAKAKLKMPGIIKPFTAVGEGFGQIFGIIKSGASLTKSTHGPKNWKEKQEKATADVAASKNLEIAYSTFKKAHGMIEP